VQDLLIPFKGKAAVFVMNMDLAIFLEFPVRGAVVRLEVMHYSVFHWNEHCRKGVEKRRKDVSESVL
jgi:hypothetical protein